MYYSNRSFPEEAALRHIYSSIVGQHIGGLNSKFPLPVVKCCDMIVSLALSLHARVAQTFLPTAIKFHYIFNLRDLSNVFQVFLQFFAYKYMYNFCLLILTQQIILNSFQAIILTGSDCINTPGAFLRIWMHESFRVYHDKMVDHKDQDAFEKIVVDVIKKIVQVMF